MCLPIFIVIIRFSSTWPGQQNEWMNEWTGLTDTIDGNWTGGPTVCVLLQGYLTQPNPSEPHSPNQETRNE